MADVNDMIYSVVLLPFCTVQ